MALDNFWNLSDLIEYFIVCARSSEVNLYSDKSTSQVTHTFMVENQLRARNNPSFFHLFEALVYSGMRHFALSRNFHIRLAGIFHQLFHYFSIEAIKMKTILHYE